MQILGDAGAIPSKEDLLAQYKTDLEKIVELVETDISPERIWQLRKVQKADLYWRQLQNLVPQFTDLSTQAYSSIGSPITGGFGRDTDAEGVLDYVQNIYRGYGRKLIGVIGQRPVNIQAVPDDPDDEESLKRTRLADASAAILKSQWNIEIKMFELVFFLWKSSTVFFYTPYVADGFKYGYTTHPKMSAQPVPIGPAVHKCIQCGAEVPAANENESSPETCPQCGQQGTMQPVSAPTMAIPDQGPPEQYPNGAVECHLCNTLYVTVPFRVRTMEELPWLRYEYEESKAKLLDMYPQLRKNPPKDQGPYSDSSSSFLAAQVRDAAASPLGVPNPNRANRWTYGRIWFQPHMFDSLEDDAKIDELKRNFPDGIKLTVVQNEIIQIENERLTDVWWACKPETSEFLVPDAIGDDMLPMQELRNDVLNIARLTIEAGVGFNFYDVSMLQGDFFKRQRAVPNRLIGVLPAVGKNLQSGFHQVPPAQFSEQMMPWIEGEENAAQNVVGLGNSVWGGGETTGTAHGDELLKNSSMQQIITIWTYVRQAWPRVFQNGVKQLAKFGTGMLRSVKEGTQGYETLMVDIAELKDTGWHFESDPAFPMTAGEQRGTLMWLLGLGDAVQQGLALFHPRNVEIIHKLLGWTGLYSPSRDEAAKARNVIHELIKPGQKPTQQPQPDGSIKMVPSIPADQFEDNHAFMAEEARSWCVSRIGEHVRIDNPDGYQNVVAWGMAHMEMANPPPPPPEAPTPRMSFSGKDLVLFAQTHPQEFQKLMTDFRLEPGTPPIQPKDGSMPGPIGAPGIAGPPGANPTPPSMPLPGVGTGPQPQPAVQ